jgi:hypothetical protein
MHTMRDIPCAVTVSASESGALAVWTLEGTSSLDCHVSNWHGEYVTQMAAAYDRSASCVPLAPRPGAESERSCGTRRWERQDTSSTTACKREFFTWHCPSLDCSVAGGGQGARGASPSSVRHRQGREICPMSDRPSSVVPLLSQLLGSSITTHPIPTSRTTVPGVHFHSQVTAR